MQELRHAHDAILTGIGTVLADDCLLNDRTGHPRCRPLLRIVMDSQLRLPLDSKMVRSASGDVLVVSTSAAHPERRKLLEARGIQVLSFDGPAGRADLRSVVEWLGRQRYLSLMIEAGAKLHGALLAGGLADELLVYVAPCLIGDPARGMAALVAPLERLDERIRLAIRSIEPIGEDWRVVARVDSTRR